MDTETGIRHIDHEKRVITIEPMSDYHFNLMLRAAAFQIIFAGNVGEQYTIYLDPETLGRLVVTEDTTKDYSFLIVYTPNQPIKYVTLTGSINLM